MSREQERAQLTCPKCGVKIDRLTCENCGLSVENDLVFSVGKAPLADVRHLSYVDWLKNKNITIGEKTKIETAPRESASTGGGKSDTSSKGTNGNESKPSIASMGSVSVGRGTAGCLSTHTSKNINTSLICNLVAAIGLVAVVVSSKFDVLNSPWIYFLEGIPLISYLVHFYFTLWKLEIDITTNIETGAIWLVVLFVCSLILEIVGNIDGPVLAEAYVIIKLFYGVIVIALTTISCLLSYKKKKVTAQWLLVYRAAMDLLFVALATLLVESAIFVTAQ